MRFEIGKLYPFVLSEFLNQVTGKRSSPSIHGDDSHGDSYLNFQVRMLECQAHVRVPFEGQTEATQDGYIFKGLTAGQWFNQFPTYYNDQLSDKNDWLVREDFNPNGGTPRQMTQATRYLEQLDRVIRHFRKCQAEVHALKAETHFKMIELELLMIHQRKVIIRPLELEDYLGKKTVVPNVNEVVLEQVTT